MIRNTALTILLALLVLAPAGAQPPWTAGGSYGTSSFHHGVGDFSDSSITDAAVDDSDTGWKLFVGRRLSDRFSLEVSYVDLNNDVDEATTFAGLSDGSGSTFPEGPVSVDIDAPGATAATLVTILPLTARTSVLARVGAAYWTADLTTLSAAGNSTRSESGVDATFGGGFQVRLGARAAVRLEWERFSGIAGNDIDLGSLGVLLRLGHQGR